MATLSEALEFAQKCLEAGELARVESICNQVLATRSEHPAAWYLLAAASEKQGNWPLAESRYQTVVRLMPQSADAHASLGNVFMMQGKLAQAQASYLRALALNPGNAQTHYNLAVALGQQNKHEEALGHYQQSVQLNPHDLEAYNNLGNVLRLLGRFDEAVASHRQAMHLRPDSPAIINNLAVSLMDQGNLDEAIVYFHQALKLNPQLAESYNNIGQARKQQGRLDEAWANFENALNLDRNNPGARWNRALLLLLQGDWQNGWGEYEWRWQQPGRTAPAVTAPRWDGSPLDGRSILIGMEQGLGDTIQFIRYARLVRERGGHVIVQTHAALQALLANVAGIDRLIPHGAPLPPHDVQASLLSLPGIFQTRPETIPAEIPYLHADARLVDHWRAFMEPLWGFKIGIAWQGNPRFCDDRWRSIPLEAFSPLAEINGVRLISLQKGPGREQLEKVADKLRIFDLAQSLDETRGPFMDTAAVMQHLDLVISSDTAVAHLAGALGVPVWLALPLVPDWRWLLHRSDSPWYPTMRLFRQTHFGKWTDVFERMAAEVRNRVAER